MDKKELKECIKQADLLIERGNIIIQQSESTIEETEFLKNLFQSQLESEKPVLRHGDWWLTIVEKRIRIFLKENLENKECVALEDCLITNLGSEYRGEPILGNIFDDLKALSEPLEEFTVYGSTGLKVELKSNGDFMVSLGIRIGTFDKEQIKKFYRNLGRVIATDKNKAAIQSAGGGKEHQT